MNISFEQRKNNLIVPFLLFKLIDNYIRQYPEHGNHWKSDLEALGSVINTEIGQAPKLSQKLLTGQLMDSWLYIRDYFVKKGVSSLQAIACIITILEKCDELELIFIDEKLAKVYREIISYLLDDTSKSAQDTMTAGAKSWTTIVKLLQKKRFFKNIEIKE